MQRTVTSHIVLDVTQTADLVFAIAVATAYVPTSESLTATLDGVDITRAKPARTIAAGLGFVPEDRHRDGFVGEFSIAENLVLDNLDEFSRRGSLQLGLIAENARQRIEEFDIRAGSATAG